jgi:hypothetical protein
VNGRVRPLRRRLVQVVTPDSPIGRWTLSSFTIQFNDLEAPSLSDERASVRAYQGWEWNFTPEEEAPSGPIQLREAS